MFALFSGLQCGSCDTFADFGTVFLRSQFPAAARVLQAHARHLRPDVAGITPTFNLLTDKLFKVISNSGARWHANTSLVDWFECYHKW